MDELIFRGGTIVTMDGEHTITEGDVACVDGEIQQVGGQYTPQGKNFEILDASGCVVMPGLVQSHVHTCQTLARGMADDLELLEWLAQRVWPYEGALERDDVGVSADLAFVELLRGGTTAILDMGTVHHTEAIFESAQRAGIRATIGKAMMDADDPTIPAGLRETTADSLAESDRLCAEWNERAGGRLRYAYSPRFALSCTEELLRDVVLRARQRAVRVHTHASENRSEIAEVKRRTGLDNIHYLQSLGMLGDDICLAHCVWLTDDEQAALAATRTHLLHCPSSNLKLASGFAAIPELLERGVRVSLGADGAPCNNNLDAFQEMRLAALIHKPRVGPTAMPARRVVELATRGGAAALGLADRIGSLEVGKLADVIAVELDGAHVAPTPDPYSALVYACRATDVRHVAVGGHPIVCDGQLLTLDGTNVVSAAAEAAARVRSRI